MKTASRGIQAVACVIGLGMALSAAPTWAQRKSAQDLRAEKMNQIPTCSKNLGAISVIEPEDTVNWWSGQQLPAPSKLIKVFVQKSRCFTLVDRGAGMDMAIVNAGMLEVYEEIRPELKELVEDVLLNRRPEATERLVTFGEQLKAASAGTAATDKKVEEEWRKGTVEERLSQTTTNSPLEKRATLGSPWSSAVELLT